MKDTLDSLKMGEYAKVREIHTELAMKRRLLDIGLTENSLIECVLQSPMRRPYGVLDTWSINSNSKGRC